MNRDKMVPKCRRNRGAAVVESAIVLPAFLLIIFGMLDLSLAVVRYNALNEAARRVAREAIVRGELAIGNASWGPAEFNGFASDANVIMATLNGALPTMNDDDVAVRIQWLDGENGPRDRVRVNLSYPHAPVTPFFSAFGTIALDANVSMRIVN